MTGEHRRLWADLAGRCHRPAWSAPAAQRKCRMAHHWPIADGRYFGVDRHMPVNVELAKRIEETISSVAREVSGAASVLVRMPDWQPVGLDEGLHWMRESLSEGLHVASRVTWKEREATVWVKLWEHGEPEPDW
jgi:hypothetical protein